MPFADDYADDNKRSIGLERSTRDDSAGNDLIAFRMGFAVTRHLVVFYRFTLTGKAGPLYFWRRCPVIVTTIPALWAQDVLRLLTVW